ncbi:MAG: hypothetical protein KC994_26470, partial [Candidatus Omnitrophica bacterium]|nr:hypothetical protein [Candidatus Omnitrophota bacterium]
SRLFPKEKLMHFRKTVLAIAAFVLTAQIAFAQTTDLNFTLLTDSSLLNHYPGEDNIIGTTDDVVSDQQVPEIGGSAPNSPSSFSYFTVTFPGSTFEQPEYEGDVIRFVTGTIDISAVGAKGNVFAVTITGGTIYGTAANPFIGPSITTLGEQSGDPDGLTSDFGTNQMSGTFDHMTETPETMGTEHTFTFPDQQVMNATVIVVKKEGFGASGNAYLDNVVTPLINDASVSGILLFEFQFTEVQNPDMGLDGALVKGMFVATTTGVIPQLTPGGETPTSTFTFTMTPTPTETPTDTMMMATNTFTLTPTFTDTMTPTDTSTPTLTETSTLTQTQTPTFTETVTAMLTCSADLDMDKDIDFQDLIIFLEQMRAFMEQNQQSPPRPQPRQ